MTDMAMDFTSDWVSNHTQRWLEHTGHLAGQPGLRLCEVGSHEGRSACWWLDNIVTHDSARLTCIDPWHHEDAWRRFIGNMAQHPGLSRLDIRRGFSRAELAAFPVDHFDLIYVDGSHRAWDVLADATMAFDRLKNGGVLIFDDYLWSTEACPATPAIGIDAFLAAFASRVDLLHSGWQVTLRKH